VFYVEAWPGPPSDHFVSSSSVCGHPEEAEWPASFEKRIRRRRRERGAEKGRVLYGFQRRGLFQDPLPIGALLYHSQSRRLIVKGMDTSVWKMGASARVIRILMLDCAAEMSRRIQCSAVEWIVESERAVREAREHGFVRVRKRDTRCTRLRGSEILLERRLP
jgi:hypothetical protein